MKASTKKILTVILAAALIFTSVVIGFADDFDSSWTAVTNASELKAIENDMTGKYYLANDITLTSEWEPIGWIGNSDVAFTGEFDGNGHKIAGLKMDYATSLGDGSNVGLFAINGGTIKNLTVASPVIYGSTQVGAIAGVNNGTISSCYVNGGKVSGGFWTSSQRRYWLEDGYQVGGVAGLNNGIIEKSINGAYVSGWLEVGGIAGRNTNTVSRCYANGHINYTSDNSATSLCMRWAAQSAARAKGENAFGRAGGIVGYNSGTIKDAYVDGGKTGRIILCGWNTVGGICGKNEGSISNVYVIDEKIIMPKNGGVFIFPSYPSYSGTYTWTSDIYFHPVTGGQDNGTVENSFYAEIVNGSMPAQSFREGGRGTECSNAEMTDNRDMYVDAGWDFDNIWLIDPVTKLPVFEFTANEDPNPPTEPETTTEPVVNPETTTAAVVDPETTTAAVDPETTTEPEATTEPTTIDDGDDGCNKIFQTIRNFWNKIVKVFLDIFGKLFKGSFGGSNGC